MSGDDVFSSSLLFSFCSRLIIPATFQCSIAGLGSNSSIDATNILIVMRLFKLLLIDLSLQMPHDM